VDPDLDDPALAGLLEELGDLRSGDADHLRDPPLGLAQLVIQATHPDEGLGLGHGTVGRGTFA
jgi:hypothetical protein